MYSALTWGPPNQRCNQQRLWTWLPDHQQRTHKFLPQKSGHIMSIHLTCTKGCSIWIWSGFRTKNPYKNSQLLEMFYEKIPLRACLTNCQSFDMKNLLETAFFPQPPKKYVANQPKRPTTNDRTDRPIWSSWSSRTWSSQCSLEVGSSVLPGKTP